MTQPLPHQYKTILLLLAFALVAALYTHVCMSHEYWRDELHAWRLVMSSDTYLQLWRNRQHDGHPMAWFSALYALKGVSGQAEHIRWVNLAFSLGSVVLLLFQSRFTWQQKLLSALTYWHAYEFTAFARNYAIGIFFCFLFCTLYPYRRSTWAKVGLALAWLAAMQCNLCTMLLGPAMAAIWIWEIYHEESRRWAIGLAAACTVVAVAAFADVFLPNIGFTHTRNPFAGRGLLFKAQGVWFWLLLGAMAAIVWQAWVTMRKYFALAPEIWCFAATSAANFVFFTCVYPGVIRHFGHQFVGLEVFLWLMLITNRGTDAARAFLSRMLLWTSAIFVFWGAYAIYTDSSQRFSALEVAATCVRDHAAAYHQADTSAYIISGHPDYVIDAMTDLCGKSDFYALGLQQATKAVSWNHTFSQRLPTAPEVEALLATQQKGIYIITNRDTCAWMAPHLIGQFNAALRVDESLLVYYFGVR